MKGAIRTRQGEIRYTERALEKKRCAHEGMGIVSYLSNLPDHETNGVAGNGFGLLLRLGESGFHPLVAFHDYLEHDIVRQ